MNYYLGTSRSLGIVVGLVLSMSAVASATPEDMKARMNPGPSKIKTQSNISVDSTTTLEHDISPEDKATLSRAGSRLLAHVIKARQEIEAKDRSKASENIGKALTLANIIVSNSPVYKVETTIKSGELTYSDDDTVHAAVIPIFSELERTDILTPIKAAKKETNNTKDNGQVRVADSDVSVTSVNFDVNAAKPLLEDAAKALQDKNTELASNDLRSVEQMVSLSYDTVDLPLVRARENLALAKIYANDGKTEEAKSFLRRASNSLETFAKEVGSGVSSETEALRKDIDNAAKDTSLDGKALGQKIESYWTKLTNLI